MTLVRDVHGNRADSADPRQIQRVAADASIVQQIVDGDTAIADICGRR